MTERVDKKFQIEVNLLELMELTKKNLDEIVSKHTYSNWPTTPEQKQFVLNSMESLVYKVQHLRKRVIEDYSETNLDVVKAIAEEPPF